MQSQSPRPSDAPRIAFVDVLRGLSSVIVVLGHFIVVFSEGPGVVAMLIKAPAHAQIALPGIFAATGSVINPVEVGVAAFFLISGLVIPLSLDSATSQAFLVKRCLRIFPTYWVALAIGIAAVFASAAYWNTKVDYTAVDYFANVFLITDFFGRFDIPSVMWTLMLEIKFYALAPLFHMALRRGLVWPILAWSAVTLALYALAMAGCTGEISACWGHRGFISRIAWEPMFIGYMLIGTLFYAHLTKKIAGRPAAFGIVFLFACFAAAWPLSPFAMHGFFYVVGYFWGLVAFTISYLLRDRIRLNPAFKFFADISYPLYVVHALVGYAVMRVLVDKGASFPVAVAVALILAVAVAWAIHKLVEAPSMALGKRLSAQMRKPARVEAPVGAAGE